MANHVSHAALPYPVKGARFTLQIPYLDADGDPTDPTTPDTEVSIDGASFADCAEEATTITGSNGVAYITLSGAETNCSMFAVAAKVASGPKNTLGTFYPRVLPVAYSGTASAGAASTITLAGCPAITDLLIGCIVRTTGGTGGGGTGGANNQARMITAYTSGRVATVTPNWETTPDATTTFEVLLTEASVLRHADVKLWQSDAQSATDLKDFADTGYDPSSHKVAGVTLVDTLTTYTGNTPQTGDAYARIGANGAGLTAVGDTSGTTTLLGRLTNTRAGYLDNLSAGAVALASGVIVTTNNDKTGYALSGGGVSAVQSGLATSSEVTSIQNNTRVVRSVPSVIERPDSGTQTYRIEMFLYDEVGNMEAPDSAPTIALVDQGGTDLSARLDSTTMTLVATGKYRAIYTASSTDDLEQLKWEFSVVEGGATRVYGNDSVIVDTTAVDFSSADRTKLTTLYDDWANDGRLDLLLDSIYDKGVVIQELVGIVGDQAELNGTNIGLVKATTDKLDDTLVDNSGTYRFTAAALALSPAGSAPSAATIADAVLDEAMSGHTTAGTLGKHLADMKTKTDLISEVYHADIDLRIDDANSRDDYRVIWWKDGDRITSAITVPTIQVIKEDATDLVAETAMTANGYTFTYRADGAERLTAGQSVEVLVTATINGGTRTFSAVLGRDSA
jgi:hypothetical protein